jgi:signal transduction histidine kinase/ActR/RegA family two-component response regulator
MEQHFQMIAPSVLEEDQKKLKDTIRRLKKVGDHGNVGYRVRHKNGNIIEIMGRIQLVEENGQLVCQRVLMDCTEQRLYEKKKLQETEAKRNQIVADALKQAEHASQSKTRFLTNMSHDIRTPMNAIIGYTALAKKHFGQQERVRDYLDKIATSSDHLLNLINDILDLNRIESGKLTLDPTPCSLVEILNDLRTVMNGQMQDRHQTFDLEINDLTDEMVLCDKLRLNQILLNILGNAVKFTPAGGKIHVSLQQFAKNESEGFGGYRFRIQDNGIGMSEDFKEHLFEQFTREKRSAVNEIPGTGLGMSITKNLVEKMDGTIQVESQLGEGTEFILSFDFPIYQTESAAPTQKSKEEVPDAGQKPKRLLLVEDNALNQEIASEILSDYGFLIEIANDGSEAVEKMQSANPGDYDIILMDIQMPVMNGYEATKKIRMLENPRLASIPIIAMTANAFEEDKKKAFHAGMNDFISKPIDVDHLLGVISSI